MFAFFKTQLLSFLNKEDLSKKETKEQTSSSTITSGEKEKILSMVKQKQEEELSKPPTIAIIGKTGVGKSSTINSLFNTNLGVSHFESCTQKAIPTTLTNGKGKIVIYDMPGLGEDIERDEQHKIEYKKILPQCDVVLWIMNIADREMSSQQVYIKEIMTYLDGRVVVCANKSDMVHPENWNTMYNVPSAEQNEILEKRIIDIRKKLCNIIPQLSEEVIVHYSATKRYKLNDLFGAMLAACPKHRGWVLNDRIDLADFTELIDKNILKELQNGKK